MINSTIRTKPEKPPSGRFVIRIEPELHATLRRGAKDAGVSLNEYCTRKLAAPEHHGAGPFEEAIRRASGTFGKQLVGVIAYGSWARNELTDRSDVDLLLVLTPDCSITRELYRAWDETLMHWGSHRVETHFVHLLQEDDRVTGVWAEIAAEGIVMFERGFEISRLLTRIRRGILARHLIRRRSQGQPYWVEGP